MTGRRIHEGSNLSPQPFLYENNASASSNNVEFDTDSKRDSASPKALILDHTTSDASNQEFETIIGDDDKTKQKEVSKQKQQLPSISLVDEVDHSSRITKKMNQTRNVSASELLSLSESDSESPAKKMRFSSESDLDSDADGDTQYSMSPSTSKETLTEGHKDEDLITLNISLATGGNFTVQARPNDNVETLKCIITKQLKMVRDKINLLYRDQNLKSGTLASNSIVDGTTIQVLPCVESGTVTQSPEQSVLQALERLSDAQVNDFLSGASPLTLAMRLGDHMMFIQLQLSTNNARRRMAQVQSESTSSGLQPPSHHSSVSSFTSQTDPSVFATNSPSSPASASPPLVKKPEPKPQPKSTVPNSGMSLVFPTLDIRALTDASRNLSTKLKELAQITSQAKQKAYEEALQASAERKAAADTGVANSKLNNSTAKIPKSKEPEKQACEGKDKHCGNGKCTKRHGAVIESMQHHGQGIYSGTFSGTLNPALQDSDGRPKRDISTIIHILNDLLGATPQIRIPQTTSKSTSTLKPSMLPQGRHACSGHHSATSVAPRHHHHHHHHKCRPGSRLAFRTGNPVPEEQVSKSKVSNSSPPKPVEEKDIENLTTKMKMEKLQAQLEEKRKRKQALRSKSAPNFEDLLIDSDKDTSNKKNEPNHPLDLSYMRKNGSSPVALCDLDPQSSILTGTATVHRTEENKNEKQNTDPDSSSSPNKTSS